MLFAKHNLLTDPPFSNLDLVSRRSLLIYLDQGMQEHVFQLVHCALNEGEYLFLGRSEVPGRATRLFSTVDKSNNILKARVLPAEKRQHVPLSADLRRGIDIGRPSGLQSSSQRLATWIATATPIKPRERMPAAKAAKKRPIGDWAFAGTGG
jgi:two-component system CheB/CheR fusion protein